MLSNTHTKHFLNRAGFGVPLHGPAGDTPIECIQQQSQIKPIHIVSIDEPAQATDAEMIRQKLKKNRSELIELNTTWFNQLTDTQAVIREKMTFFWHDHFACRSRHAFLAQQQINTIRQHALGTFGDLLMAVSKDPAILQFLNNQQNKKDSPNENFAREVMELFSLGRGHYTEDDIKNAARAFTGWAFNPNTGNFLVRERQHDNGVKTFRGKTGNFSGEDIIEQILADTQTANFITHKIVSFFVSETVPAEILNALARQFYQSNYNIEKLITTVYTSDWFYDTKYIGNRIKSPVELIAGIQTHTGGRFHNALNIAYLQKALGQVLLQPPNVSGWPHGKQWIDSASLTFRMSLPGMLLNNIDSSFQAKDDGDVNNDTNKANSASKMSFMVNLELLANRFTKDTTAATLDSIEAHLLASPATASTKKLIATLAGNSQHDLEFIKKACIGFMSVPEYQLS
jgi:uncharacterized protein (DUF1800 family)